MNEGESAGERPNIGFTPAVVNRRLIPNSSASLIPVRYHLRCSLFLEKNSNLPTEKCDILLICVTLSS